MLNRLSTFLGAICIVGFATSAHAANDAIVECAFGSGPSTTSLVLLVPNGLKKAKTRVLEIKVVPGGMEERPAIATLVQKQNSEIGQKYARVLFQTDTKTGFVVQIAENGDGVSFPIDQTQDAVGKTYLGGCNNPKILFDRWY